MEANIKRKRINWRRLTAILAILMVSFLTGYEAMAYYITGKNPLESANIPFTKSADSYEPGERINLLLLGTDARPGEKDSRTDSIIVASIEPYTKKAALISIPRDTLVELPGHGKDKINSANMLGGVDLTKQTVEGLLDIKIDHYLKTNFDGFQDIIDTLGGVTIDVEKNMRYRDPTDGTNINLKKGVQELTGKTALDYARFRHDALGDISRTERQQKILKAVAKEMFQSKTIFKLPELIPQINKAVETDLSLPEMLNLASLAKGMEDIQIVSQTLPGQFYNNHGSYWKADEELAKVVLNNMLNGVQSEAIVGPDITIAKNTSRTAKADLKNKATQPAAGTEAGNQTIENQEPNQAGNNGTTDPSNLDGTVEVTPRTSGDGSTTIEPVPQEPSNQPSGSNSGTSPQPNSGTTSGQTGTESPGSPGTGTTAPSGQNDYGIGSGNPPVENIQETPQT